MGSAVHTNSAAWFVVQRKHIPGVVGNKITFTRPLSQIHPVLASADLCGVVI